VKTILRLGKEKPSINVVNDQIGSPTYTMDVAHFLLTKPNIQPGIHHLTNDGFISWFVFATEIINTAKLTCLVNPIASVDYQTRARRGSNSCLLKTSLTTLQNWKKALECYFYEKTH
jgi:dTDP-4-dehydrorhamnose reductase